MVDASFQVVLERFGDEPLFQFLRPYVRTSYSVCTVHTSIMTLEVRTAGRPATCGGKCRSANFYGSMADLRTLFPPRASDQSDRYLPICLSLPHPGYKLINFIQSVLGDEPP